MRTTLLKTFATAAFMTVSAGMASAVTISVNTFDMTAYETMTAGFVKEDFEGIANGNYTNLSTGVGTFTSAGGTGAGSSCQVVGGGVASCNDIFAVTTTEINGQFGPAGDTFLNSLDTLGIVWEVETGSVFNKVVFAITDGGDIDPIVLNITAEDGDTLASETVSIGPNAGNGNEQMVEVLFSGLITGATISMVNSADAPDDAFAFDLAAVGVVPVPAAGLLLLGGLGALGAMRRNKKSS